MRFVGVIRKDLDSITFKGEQIVPSVRTITFETDEKIEEVINIDEYSYYQIMEDILDSPPKKPKLSIWKIIIFSVLIFLIIYFITDDHHIFLIASGFFMGLIFTDLK